MRAKGMRAPADIQTEVVLRARLETGSWMGFVHRAITPLPSRHQLGPLLAMCPSTPPQLEAFLFICSSAFHQGIKLNG